MESQHYPSLYRESDSLALRSEKRYFWLVRAKIVLLLIIAGIMSVTWNQELLRTPIAIVSAILLVVSIAFTAAMNIKNFDRVWSSSRAIAESIKTETWSFMMKVGPYDGTITHPEAEDRFLKRLDEILNRQTSVYSRPVIDLKEGGQITEHMKQMRMGTVGDRLSYYVQHRIHDQRLWYAAKAKWNRNQESRWFVITWALELAAAVIAIIVIVLEDVIINPVSIVTTAGAGVLSWANARSYSEPAESYGLVAQEIALLEDQANHVTTEEDLARIVHDVEGTIIREHEIWLSKLL